jgi:hypothetical protein
MDMRFCWVRDRVRQGQFHIAWRKGALNKADHFSNTIPPRVTANCVLPVCTNRLLATATTLAVCAMAMMTTTAALSPLPMSQRPTPFMPSPRPRAAMLHLQARVC